MHRDGGPGRLCLRAECGDLLASVQRISAGENGPKHEIARGV